MRELSQSRYFGTPSDGKVIYSSLDINVDVELANLSAALGAKLPTKTKVLIIDDNEALAELAKLMLEQLGQVVHTATTGAQGRRLMERVQPDVVVCDINLPDETGYDVLAGLRATPGASQPPCVFLSGSCGIDTDRCQRLGAAAVLTKPCPLSALSKLVSFLHASSISADRQAN